MKRGFGEKFGENAGFEPRPWVAETETSLLLLRPVDLLTKRPAVLGPTLLHSINARSSTWNTAVFWARVLSCRVTVDLGF